MEAKDTVMSLEKCLDIFYGGGAKVTLNLPEQLPYLEAQAEITWAIAFKAGYEQGYLDKNEQFGEARYRAGIREVVEFVNTHRLYAGNISIPKSPWQAQLKEWGIE